MSRIPDHVVRKEAFAWLESLRLTAGIDNAEALVLPRAVLARGFDLQGARVPLVGPQGIFIPAATDSDLPLTITTSPNGPYDDGFIDDKTLLYRYRGTDPSHRENCGLRELMRLQLPLIYLHGIVPGQYLATWPVFVIGDEPNNLRFTVRAEDRNVSDYWASNTELPPDYFTEYGEIRRQYRTAQVRVRAHQQAFRFRVIRAYRTQCALCRLRHPQLLDAAHITEDREASGEPVISNGLALCKIHHAAFDKLFLGIRPDCTVHIRRDLLTEFDGPVLQHALKEMHGKAIEVPKLKEHQPNTERLEERYSLFLAQ
ncbi:MAG: HNH endonuclease [Gammaproteobacteria bacterium]